MKSRTLLRIASILFLISIAAIVINYIEFDLIISRDFFMNIFPVPLTVMVSALMGIYALLGVWCSLGGLFGKKLKNTYRVLIWMIGFAQLFVIFSCLIIGYGFYFRLCDLLILTFTLLMPLLYNVFLIRAINSRGK